MKIQIKYSPRSAFKPFHASQKRFSTLVCHRRAGKTVAAVNRLIRRALTTTKPNPRTAYVGPTFSQAKDIAWTYLREYTHGIPGVRLFEYDLRVDLPNGGRIKLYGAENPNRLRGLYFDDVVFDEYADIDPGVWQDVVRPTLTDRGGSACFMGTPKGLDQFYDIWIHAQQNPEEWYCLDERAFRVMKASETGLIAPEELVSAFKLMAEDRYAREYECDFTASFEGAYYAKQIQKLIASDRFKKIERDPAADVYACWDLGMDDAMAIWTFQVTHSEWRWLEYYENSGLDLDHYTTWCKKRPYPIDMHYLPHDAKVRELQTGKERVRFLEDKGLRCYVVKKHSPDDRINAVRTILPRSYFDIGTLFGLEKVRMYRTQHNSKYGVNANKPLHDKMSHAADALGTGVMGIDEDFSTVYKKSDWKKPINRSSEGSYA